MVTLHISIHTLHTDTLTPMHIKPRGKYPSTWHDIWLTARSIEADRQNISECLSWSVNISIAVSLIIHQAAIICLLSCLLFSFKTHPQSTLISTSQVDTFKRCGTLLVCTCCVNINIIKRNFLLTNIQTLTRHSGCYLEWDYHRMLWNSRSCLETESQSFSSSLGHGGLVWS